MEADAAAVLAAEGLALDGDPYQLLEALAAEALAVKSSAAARVAALGEEIRYLSASGAEQLRAEMMIYERFIDRSAKFLEILSRLGLDERRVELQELLAGQFVEVMQAVLDDLDLSPTQRGSAPAIISRHLLLLRGGAR